MSTLLLSRYKIITVLAEGGMGRTLLVEDTRRLGRQCVIREINLPTDDPKTFQLAQQLFVQNTEILEELGSTHNHIPQLYAYFSDNNCFYLIQEYIEGETLEQKLQYQGTFSESLVKEILTNVLQAIYYLHSKNIIHLDIRPANILIRSSDGKPILIGLEGVFKITEFENESQPIIIGTPGYMPPEQIAGQPTFASDLYSLGITAIYLLTGKRPQELTDFYSNEILWRQFTPNITSDFAAVLDKAIRLNYRERFASTQEMLEALRSLKTADVRIVRVTASSQEVNKAIYLRSVYIPNLILSRTFTVLSELISILDGFIDKLLKKAYEFWVKGKFVIAFALGGAFLGSLTANGLISLIFALIGAIYGFFKNSNSTSNSHLLSSNTLLPEYVIRRGENVIALALGGAFIGGIIANLPGSFIGAIAGAVFSLITQL